MDCGGPVGAIAGLPIIAGGGPGRDIGRDTPGNPLEGADCEKGVCWPKGDGLGP